MSIRPVSRIAGCAIAVIVFFAVLPLQAGFMAPAEDFTYDGESLTGSLKFSWKTIPHEVGVKIQYKGGGTALFPMFSSWTTASLTPSGTWDGKTHVLANRPTNVMSGQTFQFRLTVAICRDWSRTQANVCRAMGTPGMWKLNSLSRRAGEQDERAICERAKK